MDLQTLRKRVAFIVRGSDSNMSTVLSDQIDAGLNEAQSFLHTKVQQMVLRRDGEITLVADTSEYNLPAGFMKMIKGTVYSDARPEYPLGPISPQDHTRFGFNVHTHKGVPEAYWIDEYDVSTERYVLRVIPTPGTGQAGNKIFFKYNTELTEMSLDTDKPELPSSLHRGLVHGCLVLSLSKMLEPQVLQLHAAAWKDYIKLASKHSDPLLGRRTPMRESSLRERRRHNRGTFRNFDIDP